MILYPNSGTRRTSEASALRVRLREYNQCHEPGGRPTGGRFCSRTTGSSSREAYEKDRAEFKRLRNEWARINIQALKHLNEPDSPEAEALLAKMKDIVKRSYRLNADPGGTEGVGLPGGPRDMVIVGAGPGGLAAGIMGGTEGMDTLIIDAQTVPGGQAKFSSRIENFPGFPMGVTGKQLTSDMFVEAERVGAETKLGVRVVGLTYDPATGLKTLSLSTGETIETRAVVIAGGVEFKKLDFPGSDANNIVVGDGERLAEVCAGKSVCILGGSNGAAQAALGAAETAETVYVLSRSPITKGMSDYQVQALRNHPKIKLIEGDELQGLTKDANKNPTHLFTRRGERIAVQALGIFLGSAPNLEWTGVKLKDGKAVVNSGLETNIPGVFAIGDARQGSLGRVGFAVGDGQFAQRSVFDYFERERQGS